MRYHHLILREGSATVETYLTKGRIPSFLQGLAAEARKAGSFETFKHDYLIEIKHGIYWHWTDDPNFFIDPAKGPRDMTSMGGGHMDPGKLMVTSHLENWADYGRGGRGRPYVALVDLSAVPRNDYYQVKRSFGNEFMVDDPSKAKVGRVVSPQTARRLDRRWEEYMPASEEQLRRFYELAIGAPLHEGFDTSVNWRWTERSRIEWVAVFKIGKVTYTVSLFLYDSTQDAWELSFIAESKKQDYGYRASGTGNAWKVFGTVIHIARVFIGANQPRRIKIESDTTERSRHAVNQRLGAAIIRDQPYPYTMTADDSHIWLDRA